MKELMEYREKLVERLGEAAREFCETSAAFADPFIKVAGDWTVHQIASHTRDVQNHVYGLRIRQTASEENPTFANFDADTWMADNYKPEESFQGILSEFSTNVNEVCDLLKTLSQEEWSRLSRHVSLGGDLTLQLWAERSLAHIEEHLKTLKTGLNS